MNHLEASRLMGVSRATFARIYESARRKIARALVETREIRSVFGNAVLDKSWYECNSCHARFTIPLTVHNQKCPMCKNESNQPHKFNNMKTMISSEGNSPKSTFDLRFGRAGWFCLLG